MLAFVAARSSRAFTLIELLVVVAVIAVLVAVLLPALAAARGEAVSVACMSNMRTLAIAQQAYAGENGGALVDYGLSHGGTPLAKPSWLETLGPYFDDTPIVRSPADSSVHWDEPIAGSLRVTSYGLNEHVTPSAPIDPATGRTLGSGNLIRVKNPNDTVQWIIMAYEGPFAVSDHVHVINWWLGDFLPDAPPGIAASMCQTNAHSGPVGGWSARSRYAFLDGRVETKRFDEVYTTATRNSFFTPSP